MDEARLSEPAQPSLGQTAAAWPAAFAFILALGGLPTIIFGLLIAAGALKPLPGLLAWAVCVAFTLGFAILLSRDVATMGALVRALRTNPDSLPSDTSLFIPGMRAIGQEAIRLARAERLSRARLIERSAADHTLLERLPDPLLRLGHDGAMTWRNASAVSAFGAETAVLLRHPDIRVALAQARAAMAPVRGSLSLAVRSRATSTPPSSPSATPYICSSPTAPANAVSRKCAPTSSPIPATNYAPRSPA